MSFLSIDASTTVDPGPIADAVVDALGPDLVDADTVEARCVAAIIDKSGDANGIPTVAQNQASIAKTSELQPAAQAAITASSLPTAAQVATAVGAQAACAAAISAAITANTIPSGADVDAVPAAAAAAVRALYGEVQLVKGFSDEGLIPFVFAELAPSPTEKIQLLGFWINNYGLTAGSYTFTRDAGEGDNFPLDGTSFKVAAGATLSFAPLPFLTPGTDYPVLYELEAGVGLAVTGVADYYQSHVYVYARVVPA